MKTKQKILHTAISMFNEQGFGRISLRDISDQMNISPGNLTYHYRNRDELLLAIYEMMYQEMEEFFGQKAVDPMEILGKVPQQTESFIYRYRFFFADLKAIFQEFPFLALRHREVVAKRLAGGHALVSGMIKAGYFHPEPSPGAYQPIVHLIWMVPTFWYNQFPVLPEDHPARQEEYLHKTIFALIQPYLTPKGIDKWTLLTSEYNETN